MYGYQHILHSEKPLTKCLWNVILVVDLHKKGNVRKIDVQGNMFAQSLVSEARSRRIFSIQWPLSLYHFVDKLYIQGWPNIWIAIYLSVVLIIKHQVGVFQHAKISNLTFFPAKQDFSFLYHSWLNSHNKIRRNGKCPNWFFSVLTLIFQYIRCRICSFPWVWSYSSPFGSGCDHVFVIKGF